MEKDLQILETPSRERVWDFDNSKYIEQAKQITAEAATIIIFDDATKKFAKEKRADLNRQKDAIDGFRKACEKEYTKPAKEFKLKIDQILQEFDRAISTLDARIKEIENAETAEKMARLEKYWADKGLGGLFPFSWIYQKRWELKGETETKVQAAIDMIAIDCEQIKALIDKQTDPVIQTALMEKIAAAPYTAATRAQLEADVNKYELAKIQAQQQAAAPAPEDEGYIRATPTTQGMKIEVEEEPKSEPVKVNLWFFGSVEDINALLKYAKSLGVTYGRS